MKKLLYIVFSLLLLTLCVVPQDVWGGRFFVAQKDKKHYEDTLPNDSLRQIISIYSNALRTKDQNELFESYSMICELCVRYGDYKSVREYAMKAIEIDKKQPVRKSTSHLYILLYRSLLEHDPSQVTGYSYICEALSRAKTDEDRFEANLAMADYCVRKGLRKTYFMTREKYMPYATKDFIRRYSTLFLRAEAYRHIYNNDIDSALLVLNRITVPKYRTASILRLYRIIGKWDKAMQYADSTDMYLRIENYSEEAQNISQIEALVERSNISYARLRENYEIALSKADIQRRMLLQENLRLEAERGENETEKLQQRAKMRMYTMRLDSARMKQQRIELSHREAEAKLKAIKEEKFQITLGIIILAIIAFVLALVALFMWLWVRSGRRMTANMMALAERQEKLRQEAVAASRGRDSFIKNMSEEMQVPLKEVSEYAKILASPDSKLSDEDRMVIGIDVQEKSTKIIDHINSILNPDEYVTNEERESEEQRIEEARKKYLASLSVVLLLLVMSPIVTARRDHLAGVPHREYSKLTAFQNAAPNTYADSSTLSLHDIIRIMSSEEKPYLTFVQQVAYRNDYDPKRVEPFVETALSKAVALKDTMAHCMLLSIRMRCHRLHGTYQEFYNAAQQVRNVSSKYGIMRFYYYSFKEEIVRCLHDGDIFHALRILDFLESQKIATGNRTAEFYEYFSRMMISRERDEPAGVVEWAKKALEVNREVKIRWDISQIYLEIFRHTKDAVHSDYGANLLDYALRTAITQQELVAVYLEKAFCAGSNLDSAEYYKNITLADSVKYIAPTYYTREHIARAYHWVFKNNIYKALQEMQKEDDPVIRYRFQLALAKRNNMYQEALAIRDSLVVSRADALSDVMSTDLYALRKMYGNDSLAQTLVSEKNISLALEQQQGEIALEEQRLLIEQEQRKLKLRKAQMEDYARQHDLQLQKAELESQRIALNTQAAKAVADSVEAEKKRLTLYVIVAILVVIATVGSIIMLVAWRIRNRRLYTSLSQKNKEISQARAEALMATERKDLFIQNMSHEIRTPLNAIAGFAQLLALPEESFTPQERERFAQHVEHNASLLSMLINDIVNMGNLERGTYSIEYNNITIGEITHVAIGTVEYRIPGGVKMIYKSSLPDDYRINTDGRRVIQVLINYLTNAIKHIVEGSITLQVRDVSINGIPTIRFTVSDTGTGVPPEQRDRIFMRFVKLEKFVQGTGLGLSICRIIAEKMGGRCYLDIRYPDDTPGVEHGARFVFEIPLLPPTEGTQTDENLQDYKYNCL